MLRRLGFVALGLALVVAAFSTGVDYLFFLLYLGILLVGGGYLLTRFGLSDLEAGYTLDRLHAQVGDTLRATYTLRNRSPLPKLWLEAHNPSTLPVPLPGRALALGSRAERSWIARVPLVRRGHFRVDPMRIRSGDPFGLFEATATVGSGHTVIVYPRVEALPGWRLPPVALEGTHVRPERSQQTSPLVTSVRPYVPGDAFSRIHWKSSARQQELQVKEFDIERTADVWLFLDLERRVHTGAGEESTLEAGVRLAASIAGRALVENRAVGLQASAVRNHVLPPDRGNRQRQKVMQLLASVDADGSVPLTEALVTALPRLRRGMTAIVITPSLERDWVRSLAGLRGRGVVVTVCLLDPFAYDEYRRARAGEPSLDAATTDEWEKARRALRHALAEYELPVHVIVPGRRLGELLVSGGSRQHVSAR